MNSLLIELLTEELPPKALRKLGEAFASTIALELAKRGLRDASARCDAFATPRRLGVLLSDVLPTGTASKIEKKLMPGKVAFDASGAPSASLNKRLEKEGATAVDVQQREEGGEAYAWLVKDVPGASLTDALQGALEAAIKALPIPKVMRYHRDGARFDDPFIEFVRPAHGLIALYGEEVLPVSVLGLSAGRSTRGHRFQGEQNITIKAATDYVEALSTQGAVIASFALREDVIRHALEVTAKREAASLGPQAAVDALLDEVTALVERPCIYVGEFEADFLRVPQECLILTMRANQKYFPLFDSAGKLKNRFLIVSNMTLGNPHNIVEGNQRVVRPRLADARFFYEVDLKTPLADLVPRLAQVVYHNKLGSQLQRVERVKLLAAQIARQLHGAEKQAVRAAHLAKADLLTQMVGEFPELQGIMGTYYAQANGEDIEVARAITEHYMPRFAGDVLPTTWVGTVLALADKLESLTGIFGIGLVPTGDRDPYALRRAALGVLRLLIEKELPLDLPVLLTEATLVFANVSISPETAETLYNFILERLNGTMREAGFSAHEVDAVLSQRPARMNLVSKKLAAVHAFSALPEAQALAAANKRVVNILKKSEGTHGDVQQALLSESAERALFDAVRAAKPAVDSAFEAGDYAASLKHLAGLRASVDAFFEGVMVNAEDLNVRRNRHALLNELAALFNRVADISRLAV